MRTERVLADEPAVVRIKRPRSRPVRPALLVHSLAATELILRRELDGAELLTELEIRELRSLTNPWDLSDYLSPVVTCDRIPDAVERLPGGGLRAWEIELSSKGRRRREAIHLAYAASSYSETKWIVPEPRLAALIRAELEAMADPRFTEVLDDIPKNPR